MKIKTQTESVLTVKEGNFLAPIFGLVFFFAGVWMVYKAINLVNVDLTLWIISIVFIVTGLTIVFFSYAITVDFDKTSGQVIYQEKGLLKSRKAIYNISDIVRIEMRNGWKTETQTTSKNKPGFSISKQVRQTKQVPISQTFLIFKDGLVLAINRENTPSSGILVSGLNASTEITIAKTVATFIGVPFQAILPTDAEPPIITGLGGGIQL